MDEIVLDGKTYVGSKKAAQECGYAQDYVGQLARKGFIDAKRVSGQWYVHIDSLKAYKQKAETFKPEPPKYTPDPSVESSITGEGKEYVSAARAAKLAEYNQDYIAQLARAGKIPSKQVGNRWYVEPEALLLHKQEKDAMLRAVQAESVGLKRPDPILYAGHIAPIQHTHPVRPEAPLMKYATESKPLFPEIAESVALKAVTSEPVSPIEPTTKIPVRVLRPLTIEVKDEVAPTPIIERKLERKPVAIPRKSMRKAISWQVPAAVALVIIVAVGTYKRDAIIADASGLMNGSQTAAVGESDTGVTHVLRQLLTKELVYVRK